MTCNVIICDHGTGFVKCGFSGLKSPTSVFPTVVGRPILRYDESLSGKKCISSSSYLVGEGAASDRQYLELAYPIENGIVKNWDDMTLIWDYAFHNQLGLKDLKDNKILVTEPPMNPKKNREKMLEIMMEKFEFDGVHIAVPAILTLYAEGLPTGIVVDCGEGVTNIVTVCDGFVLPHLTKRLDIAGSEITSYLIRLLCKRGYAFNRSADMETLRLLKEKLCYVGFDIEQEKKLARETTSLFESYMLPDNKTVKLDSERFEAPEILFNPDLIGIESPGIPELLFNAIQSADMDIRSTLYKSIILTGGSSMLPGFSTRLEREIRGMYLSRVLKGDKSRESKYPIHIKDHPERKYLPFLGGSLIAELTKNDAQFWISRKEWNEVGIQSLSKFGVQY